MSAESSVATDLVMSLLDHSDDEEVGFLFETRTHPGVAPFLLGPAPGSMESHRAWLAANVPASTMLYVARMGEELAGYCQLHKWASPGPAEVGFVVHPDWQGRGCGSGMVRLLVSEVERLFPGRGVCLRVRADNDKARRLYERRGFVASAYSEGVMSYELKGRGCPA